MASFVIHHTTGVNFLNMLEELNDITITDENKKRFLLGNLIVDSIREKDKSKVQEEKIATHFRDHSKLDHATQYPDLNLFLEKYGNLIPTDYSVLGYFFHLYTDYMFFTYLFEKTFEYLDQDGEPTELISKSAGVHIKKDDKVIPLNRFFNGNESGMYHDYTIMNKIVLDAYGIDIDIEELINWAKDNFKNPGIEEVDYELIESVLRSLKKYIDSSIALDGAELDVFDKDDIISFIDDTCKSFIEKYYKKHGNEGRLTLQYNEK